MINFVTDVTFEMTLICNCLYLTEQQVTTLITAVHLSGDIDLHFTTSQ